MSEWFSCPSCSDFLLCFDNWSSLFPCCFAFFVSPSLLFFNSSHMCLVLSLFTLQLLPPLPLSFSLSFSFLCCVPAFWLHLVFGLYFGLSLLFLSSALCCLHPLVSSLKNLFFCNLPPCLCVVLHLDPRFELTVKDNGLWSRFPGHARQNISWIQTNGWCQSSLH